MKGITIKLPDHLLKRLAAEAEATGRSIGALVREKLEADASAPGGSVYDQAADLIGSLSGSGRGGSNSRRKFRRS